MHREVSRAMRVTVHNRQNNKLSSMEQTMDLDWVSAALRVHWPVAAELFESDSEGMSNVVDAFILVPPSGLVE